MEIKKGNRFVCVKDVYINNGDGTHVYKKGNVYKSEEDSCITDEQGNKYHFWRTGGDGKYFIPYSKLDRVYTKYTERLEKLFDAYEGKKDTDHGKVAYYCNCDSNENTGWFWGDNEGIEDYYQEQGYTYLSEQAFIEFMGLSDTTDTKAPQPHYDNSNGSLFQLAEQLGLNHWEFDILKRLVRCRKKGQFKEDLQKIKDTCDIYLNESPQ